MEGKIFFVLVISSFLIFLVYHSINSDGKSNYQAGSICTIEDGEGGFGVVKILIVIDGYVHVKLFRNNFKSRPDQIELSSLSIGSIDNPEGFGIGHIPLQKSGFDNWNPEVIGFEEVQEEELEGYYYWKDQ